MRWVTYFPKFERVHLTKDVGLIPFYAGQNGFKSKLIGHADTSISIPEEVEDLDVELLEEKGKLFFLDRAFLGWLRANAAKTDVLHLFHLSRDTVFYGAYFKRLNPKGKLYLKMDAYNEHLLSRKRYAKNPIKNAVIKRTEKEFFRHLDLATIENREGIKLAAKTYPELKPKIEYLPNGVNDLFLKKRFPKEAPKEKIIFSVGRLGSADKNYELFLKALPTLDLPDWKFVVVGPIDESFQAKIDNFLSENPELEDRVSFKGAISDRAELYDLYARASVFFLPSRFESFGISFVEALYFGTCLVGHEGMCAFGDISDGGEYGVFFLDNDPRSFAEAMVEAVQKADKKGFCCKAAAFGQTNFSQSAISRRLLTKLGYA